MANIERLQKLADHLLHGKLGHEKFDFDHYNDEGTEGKPCGTAGCAIGECPTVWPDIWKWRMTLAGSYTPVTGDNTTPGISAREFFELSIDQRFGLFIPFEQHRISLPVLGKEATKEQVAANILLFIERQTKTLA